MKRILAILAVLLLAGMYLATLVFVLIRSEWGFVMFKASILMTIAVPCLLYAMILVYNFLKNKKK